MMEHQYKDQEEIGTLLNEFRKCMEILGKERKKSKVNNTSGTFRSFRGRFILITFILLGFLGSSNLIYGQGTTEDALFIDKDGNVGIGTDKPAATLDVRGRIKDESGFVMPKGGIIMWSGKVSDIPQGWTLCDGTKGTPDLRGRFIIGADNGKLPNPNEYGEPDTHDHQISQQLLTFNTSAAGEHDHQTCTLYWYNNLTYGAGTGRTVVDARGTDVHLERTSKVDPHTHSVPVDLRKQNTGIYKGSNRPRWYALCFIMKL